MKIYTIENEYQKLEILGLGATIHRWFAFSDKINIVISNYDLNDYLSSDNGYFGATIGRYTNRIKNGEFYLDGIYYQLNKNDHGKHTLHGGKVGFNLRQFEVLSHDSESIVLKYESPHLEEGFPGDLTLTVKYQLKKNEMIITYCATTTKDTPVNITNHAHFNLGDSDILEHNLLINADYYYEVDKESIISGKILKVENTPLDFRRGRLLKKSIEDNFFENTNGVDHLLKLNKERPQIILFHQNRQLEIKTTYPCVQVYTMNYHQNQRVNNEKFRFHQGVALECQFETDAVNNSNFSDTVLKPNQEYYQQIHYILTED